jgi:hypothetical protein
MGLRARSTGLLALTQPQTEFANSQGTMENHTVFLVDFGGADSSLSAGCGQERELRGRRPRLTPLKLEERARARAEIDRLDEAAQASVQQLTPTLPAEA